MAQITPTNDTKWTNRHDTFTQQIENLFDVANSDTGDVVDDYNSTTVAIQGLMRRAIVEKKTLRALGGGWSFSKVAATDGWIVNTKQLNMMLNVLSQSISPEFTGDSNQLLFAQCGNSVQELHSYLNSKKKSLKTCGASNGQTIVGAFSTGTHGSCIDIGSTADFITGLHLIVSPDDHFWLEKASYPVVSDSFVQRLQTKLIRDDDLFNSALVSFGSFGFIHGVMFETEPVFLLECYRQRYPLDDALKHVMETLDFSTAHFLPHGNERPFHFQVVVNQYDLQRGAYVTIMYKRPYTDSYQPPVVDQSKAGPGDDVPAFLGKLTDLLPVVTPFIVNQLIKTSFVLYSNVWGKLGEIFTNNDTRGRVLSTAMAIPISYVNEVNELLIELNRTHGSFSGILSYRYVKKSDAVLGFTKYDRTCIVELDGVESSVTRNFYEVVWNEMEARNIPYTFHWGKIGNMDLAKLQRMYNDTNIKKWIKARNTLMPVETIPVFNNETLVQWGLDTLL